MGLRWVTASPEKSNLPQTTIAVNAPCALSGLHVTHQGGKRVQFRAGTAGVEDIPKGKIDVGCLTAHRNVAVDARSPSIRRDAELPTGCFRHRRDIRRAVRDRHNCGASTARTPLQHRIPMTASKRSPRIFVRYPTSDLSPAFAPARSNTAASRARLVRIPRWSSEK